MHVFVMSVLPAVCIRDTYVHIYVGYQKKKGFLYEHVLMQCCICPTQILSLLNRQVKPRASWDGKRKKSGDGKHGFTGRAGRAWELCSLQCKGQIAGITPTWGICLLIGKYLCAQGFLQAVRSHLSFEREQLMEECLNTGANSSGLGN